MLDRKSQIFPVDYLCTQFVLSRGKLFISKQSTYFSQIFFFSLINQNEKMNRNLKTCTTNCKIRPVIHTYIHTHVHTHTHTHLSSPETLYRTAFELITEKKTLTFTHYSYLFFRVVQWFLILIFYFLLLFFSSRVRIKFLNVFSSFI